MLNKYFFQYSSALSLILSVTCTNPANAGNTSSGLSQAAPEETQDRQVLPHHPQQMTPPAQLQRDNTGQPCAFQEIPTDLVRLIFSHLPPQGEAKTRLVCRNWRDITDHRRGQISTWFRSHLWELPPATVNLELEKHPYLIFDFMDNIDPIALPDVKGSMRGEHVQTVAVEITKQLRSLATRSTFPLTAKTFKAIASNPANHVKLHRHFKAVWLLSQREADDGANRQRLALLAKTLDTLIPEEFLCERGILSPRIEIQKGCEWLQHQPFWSAYTTNGSVWKKQINASFAPFKSISTPSEAMAIATLADNQLPSDSHELDEINTIISRFLVGSGDSTTLSQLEEKTPSKGFFAALEMASSLHETKNYAACFAIFENLLSDNKFVMHEGNADNLRIYVSKKYLKAIIKSPLFYENEAKARALLSELRPNKSNVVFSLNDQERNSYRVEISIKRKGIEFYRQCIETLTRKRSLIDLLKAKKNKRLVIFTLMTYCGKHKLSPEEETAAKIFMKKCFIKFKKTTKKLSAETRLIYIKAHNTSQILDFIARIFHDDQDMLDSIATLQNGGEARAQ